MMTRRRHVSVSVVRMWRYWRAGCVFLSSRRRDTRYWRDWSSDVCSSDLARRESDGRPLRPWLIRIAHNLAANHFRNQSRRPQTPIDDTTVLSALHTTEDLVEGRDELARILDGVQQLPGDRKEALIMRFALGMDNREIARALGRSDGATKVLIHRAIRQLEEIVSEDST